MTKSNGIKSLKQAAKLLNKHAPEGESLAYINPDEGRILKAHGGSGIMTLQGVPTYGLDLGKMVSDAWKYVKNLYTAPTTGPKNDQPVYDDKGRRINAPRSIVGDTLSIIAYFRAKKMQKD